MTSPPDTRAGDVVRLRLPRAPEPPPWHPFPLLASLAPVVGSVVIWAITSSPFALVFALLGPIIAIASFADAQLQGRRSSRRERDRFAVELADLDDAVRREHDRERERLHLRTPGAVALLDPPERDPERWHGDLQQPTPVVLGYGEIGSAVVLDGAEQHQPEEAVAALLERAATLDGAPVVVDARLGIGVCGPMAMATAVARGLILQLANSLPPERTAVAATACEGWMAGLPHSRVAGATAAAATEAAAVVFSASGVDGGLPDVTRMVEAKRADAIVAVADTPRELPHRCRVVLRVGGAGRAAVVGHPEPAMLGELEVVYLSAEQATESAELLGRAAEARRGVVGALPDRLQFAAMPVTSADLTATRRTLRAVFLCGESGPVAVDLVGDGPHAVVGGMTGSGKSELLLSWLLGLAAAYEPSEVSFLLVDFKGGSAFSPLMGLPHVVGLVTDLDERTARRALHSLRAEVRHRERVLAEAGARSIEALAPSVALARLVIVVDEFAALVGDFTELHELFADLAARGRSLGIHLILCTQRPAGVVRDSVLANVPLRLSLRVNNRADSSAVVGTDAAAALPAHPAGRAVLALAGGDPTVVQVAIVESGDVARVATRWAGVGPDSAPWCPELPRLVSADALESATVLRSAEASGSTGPGEGYAFGLIDLPDLQRQDTARWNPQAEGSLLVLGAGGSGKSQLLATLAEASGGRLIPSSPEEAWDAVAAAVDDLRRGRARAGVLLIDDLDVLVTRFGDEHRDAFAGLLQELLRTGGGAGLVLVLAARRLSGGLQSVVAGCESRVILRQTDRQEQLLAGGTAELFRADAPPGRGEWRGAELQVATVSSAASGRVSSDAGSDGRHGVRTAGAVAVAADIPTLIVVSGRPAELARRFERSVDLTRPVSGELILDPTEPRVWVADPATWQSRWAELAALRATAPVLVDRCTLSELRSITGQRILPAPLDPTRETAWLLHPDGVVERVLASPQFE